MENISRELKNAFICSKRVIVAQQQMENKLNMWLGQGNTASGIENKL